MTGSTRAQGPATGRAPDQGAQADAEPAQGANALLYQESLLRTIETELVPRLMLANRTAGTAFLDTAGPDARPPTGDDVDRLADLLMRDDTPGCEALLSSFRERDVSLDQVLLDLLAPAARRLGERWTADECDFTQVTIGLCRIQSMLFEFNQPPMLLQRAVQAPRRVLLSAMPGSDHTLGVLMLAEFFRRDGWDVWNESCSSTADLESVLASDWFDLIGLSASQDRHLESLPQAILRLRKSSRNPDVAVMVGGPLFISRPDLATLVGADLSANDARDAVELAGSWLASHQPGA